MPLLPRALSGLARACLLAGLFLSGVAVAQPRTTASGRGGERRLVIVMVELEPCVRTSWLNVGIRRLPVDVEAALFSRSPIRGEAEPLFRADDRLLLTGLQTCDAESLLLPQRLSSTSLLLGLEGLDAGRLHAMTLESRYLPFSGDPRGALLSALGLTVPFSALDLASLPVNQIRLLTLTRNPLEEEPLTQSPPTSAEFGFRLEDKLVFTRLVRQTTPEGVLGVYKVLPGPDVKRLSQSFSAGTRNDPPLSLTPLAGCTTSLLLPVATKDPPPDRAHLTLEPQTLMWRLLGRRRGDEVTLQEGAVPVLEWLGDPYGEATVPISLDSTELEDVAEDSLELRTRVLSRVSFSKADPFFAPYTPESVRRLTLDLEGCSFPFLSAIPCAALQPAAWVGIEKACSAAWVLTSLLAASVLFVFALRKGPALVARIRPPVYDLNALIISAEPLRLLPPGSPQEDPNHV